MKRFRPVSLLLLLHAASAVQAADIVDSRGIGMELARDIASQAVMIGRKDGYHVSAVVVDRHGIARAALTW